MTATPPAQRHIVALGGGGFSMEPENLALDRYVLSLARTASPRVCFVGTASGDAQSYIDRFYDSFRTLDCEPAHLSLFKPPVWTPASPDLRALVLAQDVIYVGGGSTRNLVVLWREWGLDEILREAWQAGVVLSGISAGAICWFEQGLSDSIATGELHPIDALSFLPGSFCPHYDGEAERRPILRRNIAAGTLAEGYAADDSVALHFHGTKLVRTITSQPGKHAYRVRRSADGASEEPILPELIR